MKPLCPQFCMNARASILTPILMIRILNTLRKDLVILCMPTFPSHAPIIVAILRDLKHLAHTNDGKLMTILVNKLEFYGWGCAKMLTAFFNISLSCCNISI
jgi:hypothetical protein